MDSVIIGKKKAGFNMTHQIDITVTLTEEENKLIEQLALERGFQTSSEAFRALLHDAIAIYDALWDKTFEQSQDLLDHLADEARAAYLAGETEDFDFSVEIK